MASIVPPAWRRHLLFRYSIGHVNSSLHRFRIGIRHFWVRDLAEQYLANALPAFVLLESAMHAQVPHEFDCGTKDGKESARW